MYNPEKPKFKDLMNTILVFVFIVIILYQNSQISQLTSRMDRIDSEEKDINSITTQVQDLLENMDNLIQEHDKQIVYLHELIGAIDNAFTKMDDRIDDLEENNEEQLYIIANLNRRLFEISEKNNSTLITPSIETRKTPFRIGDTIAWDIESYYPLDGAVVTTWFPNGTMVWKTPELTDWQYYNGKWVVPYYTQQPEEIMVLLNDFPLGNYTYTFCFEDIFEITGSFEVIEAYEGVISEM